MNKIFLTILFLILTVFAFSTSYTVLSVTIKGNTYIASSTIEDAITIKSGTVYDEAKIKPLLLQSANNVMALGYFSNVSPKVSPGILPNTINITFYLKENPIVKVIKFEGFNLIKKDTVKASCTLKTKEPLNITELKRTLQNIYNLYRKAGYSFSVDISTNITPTSTGISVPNSTLIITSKEYAMYDVLFKGDTVASLKDLEKLVTFKTIKKIQNEAPLFKWLDSLNNDKGYIKDQSIIELRYKLLSTGYYSSVEIGKTNPATSVKGYPYLYDLTFVLKKNNFIIGGQKISKVLLKGVSLVNEGFLRTYVLSKMATSTSLKNISDVVNDIKKFYKDRNYIGIDVKPLYDSTTHVLTFNIYEKRIRKISYSGDIILKKNLLDKNLRIHEDQPLKLSGYIDTMRNFQMTGYFKNANIIPTNVSTNDYLMDITIDLQAKKYLGNFSGGITWGLDQSKINDIWSKAPDSIDGKVGAFFEILWQGIAANLKIKRSNLTGIGDDGNFTFIAGPIKKDISVDYKINWIGGTNFSPDFSIFYRNDYDTTTLSSSDLKETYGIGLKSSYSINDYNFVTLGLSLDHYKTYTASSTLKTGIEWSLISNYTFDGRDNPTFTRNGVKLSINNELKFVDINNFQYNRTKASASMFFEPLENIVMASNVVGGYIYPVDTTDSAFYLGSSNTVRGWGTDDFPSISGTRMLQLNFELRYKMPNGLILIPGFYDFGHTGGKTISSIGAALGVSIPMFGTIQIGLAYPLTDNAQLNYYFGFGGIF